MDPLYELLVPYFDSTSAPPPTDPQLNSYLNRLSTLALPDLTTTEPSSLLHAAQSHIRSLQALSKRSHKAVIASSSHLSNLSDLLPSIAIHTTELQDGLPELETAATAFATKYERSTDNPVLDRRKRALLLSRNLDRLTDILDLPTLLSSTISTAQNTTASAPATPTTSYATALDLHAHTKRLQSLYPHSPLLQTTLVHSTTQMHHLTSTLLHTLQSPTLKLAPALRTIGHLRRVAPDLTTPSDGPLKNLYLTLRLHTLHTTLAALAPLRALADQETVRRRNGTAKRLAEQKVSPASLGSQSARFLKRYVEVFREQSFAMVSMYLNIFPSSREGGGGAGGEDGEAPEPVAAFVGELVRLLVTVLREFLPNVGDRAGRESLLTQVLYCAGSLGRLGTDFGGVIAVVGEELGGGFGAEGEAEGEQDAPEWAVVMKKHRVQAGRLEVLARGVGTGTKKEAVAAGA